MKWLLIELELYETPTEAPTVSYAATPQPSVSTPPAPVNPFAKGAAATKNAPAPAAKGVSAPDTGKTSKRKMPVTSSVAVKAFKK